jgi:hypothetical protein
MMVLRWLEEKHGAVGAVSFRYDAEAASHQGEPWRMRYVDAEGAAQEAFLYACRNLPKSSTPEELARAELVAAIETAAKLAQLARVGAEQARRSAATWDEDALKHEEKERQLRLILEPALPEAVHTLAIPSLNLQLKQGARSFDDFVRASTTTSTNRAEKSAEKPPSKPTPFTPPPPRHRRSRK